MGPLKRKVGLKKSLTCPVAVSSASLVGLVPVELTISVNHASLLGAKSSSPRPAPLPAPGIVRNACGLFTFLVAVLVGYGSSGRRTHCLSTVSMAVAPLREPSTAFLKHHCNNLCLSRMVGLRLELAVTITGMGFFDSRQSGLKGLCRRLQGRVPRPW